MPAAASPRRRFEGSADRRSRAGGPRAWFVSLLLYRDGEVHCGGLYEQPVGLERSQIRRSVFPRVQPLIRHAGAVIGERPRDGVEHVRSGNGEVDVAERLPDRGVRERIRGLAERIIASRKRKGGGGVPTLLRPQQRCRRLLLWNAQELLERNEVASRRRVGNVGAQKIRKRDVEAVAQLHGQVLLRKTLLELHLGTLVDRVADVDGNLVGETVGRVARKPGIVVLDRIAQIRTIERYVEICVAREQ